MPILYTVPEAADELSLPVRTLYHDIREGRCPHVEQDGQIFLTHAQILLLRALLGTYGRRAMRQRLPFAALSPEVTA